MMPPVQNPGSKHCSTKALSYTEQKHPYVNGPLPLHLDLYEVIVEMSVTVSSSEWEHGKPWWPGISGGPDLAPSEWPM